MLYCCLIDDSMKEHWSNTHDFVLTLNHHWGFVFNVLICKTLLFLADSVVIGWWLFEETLMKQRRFCCKTYWALSLLLRSIPKHSQFIAASLMVRWSSNHETLTTSFELLLSTNALFFFSANLRSIDLSLLLRWYFFDASLSEHCWNSDDLFANISDLLCFFVLISNKSCFHAVSLMIHLRLFEKVLMNNGAFDANNID